jgi:lysozyme
MGQSTMSRIKKGGAFAVAACAFVGAWEGVQTFAYPDPATKGPPWTICYGETEGVRRGDRRTIEECKAGLLKGLDRYANKIEECVTAPLTDERWIALVSFAWNVGPAGACKSSVVRLINAGHTRAGCDALLKWNKAAGMPMRGLTRRRAAEREMCLKGA